MPNLQCFVESLRVGRLKNDSCPTEAFDYISEQRFASKDSIGYLHCADKKITQI